MSLAKMMAKLGESGAGMAAKGGKALEDLIMGAEKAGPGPFGVVRGGHTDDGLTAAAGLGELPMGREGGLKGNFPGVYGAGEKGVDLAKAMGKSGMDWAKENPMTAGASAGSAGTYALTEDDEQGEDEIDKILKAIGLG